MMERSVYEQLDRIEQLVTAIGLKVEAIRLAENDENQKVEGKKEDEVVRVNKK